MGLRDPLVISFNPFVAAFGGFEWASGVTYYARDDWASFDIRSAWKPAYAAAYDRMREAKRNVVAVSAPLLDRIGVEEPYGLVLPNGVHRAEWLGGTASVSWFEKLPRPRMVYVGTIDSRLDVHALLDVTSRYPDGSVALVGPVADQKHCSPLRRVPSVYFTGAVDRAALVSMIRGADVALISHSRNELTEAMSPLKLYEYLAGGLAVVAPDLPPLRGYGRRVVLVERHEAFVEGVERALTIGSAPEGERLRFIEDNSWERRHAELMHFVSKAGSQV